MRSGDDHRVETLETTLILGDGLCTCALSAFTSHWYDRNVRVIIDDFRYFGLKLFQENIAWRLPVVVDARFIGEAYAQYRVRRAWISRRFQSNDRFQL
jgi:hypothetical protein